ncbi:MAG TPA: glucoamylase family protein [Gemmatimonadota bacterium]|jgi:hypothetical protein|nr:glucoamylase family protein [Gemmatimonadota bacterium]
MSLSARQTRGLDRLARDTFRYFWDLTNPDNGMVPDSTKKGYPSSITATGLGLSCLVVAAERGWIPRAKAAERVRTTLRTFWYGPKEYELHAIGHRGFFYHFLDMQNGHRSWESELSTIDTTFFLAGALTCGIYFDREDAGEREIRALADALYRRADWRWALAGGTAVSHGWTPEKGFLRYRWQGYNEALLLYILALGSPTHPIPAGAYRAWAETYSWKRIYGEELLYAGPLFVHQLSHIWIDFRGIQDRFMRGRGIDYFENTRRATRVQQRYAIRNPRGFKGYGEHVWGISASDGPGPAVLRVAGEERRFWDYRARGVPWGPDDGTLTPWAVVASLPFEPVLVAATLDEIDRRYPEMSGEMGYKCSFNPTFPDSKSETKGWISVGHYGLDQGPVVLMIENYRSELLWRLMRSCPYVVRGLRRAGFRGGWLGSSR